MNSVTRMLSIIGLSVAGVLVGSAPALADHSGIGISVYGGGHSGGYSVSWHDSGRGHRDYRDGHRDYGYANRYNRSYSTTQRDPWCPTHGQHHNHSYGYYGFNGGYYGVYDGNSYEEVFARAYDAGYGDGYNALGPQRVSGARAYRKGYDQGYRDGVRDGRSAPRGYGYR